MVKIGFLLSRRRTIEKQFQDTITGMKKHSIKEQKVLDEIVNGFKKLNSTKLSKAQRDDLQSLFIKVHLLWYVGKDGLHDESIPEYSALKRGMVALKDLYDETKHVKAQPLRTDLDAEYEKFSAALEWSRKFKKNGKYHVTRAAERAGKRRATFIERCKKLGLIPK